MLIGKILCQDSTHNNTADHSSLQENCDKWNLPPSPTSVQKIIDLCSIPDLCNLGWHNSVHLWSIKKKMLKVQRVHHVFVNNLKVWNEHYSLDKKEKTDYVLLTIYLGKQLVFCSSDGRESAHIGGESNPLRVIRLFVTLSLWQMVYLFHFFNTFILVN